VKKTVSGNATANGLLVGVSTAKVREPKRADTRSKQQLKSYMVFFLYFAAVLCVAYVNQNN